MPNYKMNYGDLFKQLEKQTNLLIDLCYQFDKGNYDYVDIISTKIASIIHFSKQHFDRSFSSFLLCVHNLIKKKHLKNKM